MSKESADLLGMPPSRDPYDTWTTSDPLTPAEHKELEDLVADDLESGRMLTPYARQALKKALATITDEHASFMAMVAEVRAYRERWEDVELARNIAYEAIRRLREEQAALVKERNEYRAGQRELQERIPALVKERDELKHHQDLLGVSIDWTQTTRERDAARRDVAKLIEDINGFTARIRELMDENAKLVAENERLRAEQERDQNNHDVMRDRLAERLNELKIERDDIAQRIKNIEQLWADEVDVLAAQVAALVADRDNLSVGLGDWRVMHDRRMAEREALEEVVEQLKADRHEDASYATENAATIARLAAYAAMLREVLERLEWGKEKSGWIGPVACCPACFGVPVRNFLGDEDEAGPRYEQAGHKADCWLAAALAGPGTEGEDTMTLTVEHLAKLRREWEALPMEIRLAPRTGTHTVDAALNFAEWLLPRLGTRPQSRARRRSKLT